MSGNKYYNSGNLKPDLERDQKPAKYKNSILQNILNVKINVVTRNNEAVETISLSLRKYSHNIPGNPLCRNVTARDLWKTRVDLQFGSRVG